MKINLLRLLSFSLVFLLLTAVKLYAGSTNAAGICSEITHTEGSTDLSSNEGVECWNKLFGKYMTFDTILSYEIADLTGEKDIGVLFTALGNEISIPVDALSFSGDYSRFFFANKKKTKKDLQYHFLYGLFVKDHKTGEWTLKAFGTTVGRSWYCEKGDGGEETQWVTSTGKKICEDAGYSRLRSLKIQRLLSNTPPQIEYMYEGEAEGGGILNKLFLYKNDNLEPIFYSWHDKYGGGGAQYYEDKIIEYTALHTPFEMGTHSYWSFDAVSEYKWNRNKFTLTNESITPLQLNLDKNSDYAKGFESSQEKGVVSVFEDQSNFEHGKEKWHGSPISVAEHYCTECTNFKTVFKKKGVAVIWADYIKGTSTYPVSIYLYRPFYKYKNKGAKSVWEVVVGEDDRCRAAHISKHFCCLKRGVRPWDLHRFCYVKTEHALAPQMPETGAMVYIPADWFWMGCNPHNNQCYGDEKPYHKVYLDAYYIDKYDVTADEYAKCVNAGKCQQPSDTKGTCNYGVWGSGNNPINCIDWYQANAYCLWVGKQLPTEAQWEKAARGIYGREYPWGNKWDSSAMCYNQPYTCAVGSYPQGASPYGVMDMAGNVLNWCKDWYDSDYYANSPDHNPQGPGKPVNPQNRISHVVRGGCYESEECLFTDTYARHNHDPSKGNSLTGFRCVRQVSK